MAREKPKPPRAERPRIVNAVALAEFLRLTKQRIHQLVAEGLPRELRGKYDLDKSVRWYVHYLQSAIEKRAIPLEGDELVGEQRERVRKMRFDADLKEIELARERGQLVAIADVEKEMADLILTTKARLMAVASRLAPELLGETSRVVAQAKIDKALREVLAQLAVVGLTRDQFESLNQNPENEKRGGG